MTPRVSGEEGKSNAYLLRTVSIDLRDTLEKTKTKRGGMKYRCEGIVV